MSALRRQTGGGSGVQEAHVASPDPDALTVVIRHFDDDHLRRDEHDVVAWPRDPERVPARGDRCWVARDEIGRVVVVVGVWTGEGA